MAQNFVQDGVTLQAPVASGVTKIYTGTPIYLSAGGLGAAPAGKQTGIDGVSMNTCSATADAANYITTTCVYQTEGVFVFKCKTATTFVLGDDAFIDAVDNSTATETFPPSFRTTITNRAGASSGDVAIGKVVGLGPGYALGSDTTGANYVQVKLATRLDSNIANK